MFSSFGITGESSSHPLFSQIQLSDQSDSKTLLGTYCCTQTPGEFIWRPGSLTQVSFSFLLFANSSEGRTEHEYCNMAKEHHDTSQIP